jgi:peptidoglycan endopeptidase LytE
MTGEEKRYCAIAYAWTLLGTPYIWGGESPQGMDCSGFCQEVLRSVGIDPEHDQNASALYWAFREHEIDEPTAGCLLFYGRGETDITHVAMAITDEIMIEAGGGGSRTTTAQTAHRHKAFVRMRPIDRREDLVAIVDPFAV